MSNIIPTFVYVKPKNTKDEIKNVTQRLFVCEW